MSQDREASDVVARFVERWVADRRSGTVASLDAYLARFPGAAAQVARCFAELDALPAPAPDGAEAGASDGGEPSSDSRVGPFRLLRELGRGGQAVVHLAHDLRFDRQAAVKVLEGVGPSFEIAARRLKREAEIVGRLDHPGLCTVFDAGFERGRGYVAMRYVEGETWQRRLARRRERGGLPTKEEVREAAAFAAKAARALHVAHEAGVVHRDVKPGNLMATPDGSPVVLDFGLAHDAALDGGTLTATGDVFGTPAYMAPEQAVGAAGRPDRRIDVFALGASLFEAVTLQRAFEGPTREAVLTAVLKRDPPDARDLNPDVGADLSVVIATALAKEPERRYATAAAFADDLERVLAHRPIAVRPLGAFGRAALWSRRRPAVAALLAVVVCGSVVTALSINAKNGELNRKNEELSRTLEEVLRLADANRVRDLVAWDDRLWPVAPERLGGPDGVDAWLEASDAVLRRRPLHAGALARLTGGDSRPAAPSAPPGAAAPDADPWRREMLQALLQSLDELAPRRDAMRVRRERCAAIARDSVEAARDAWAATVAEIARDARYAGLALRPQVGLVPLGRDRDSGLFEFSDLRTGRLARRDPGTGKIKMEAETGMVFVLVPPGTFRMGAVPPSEDVDAGGPNVDRNAARFEAPVRDVTIDAFLMSKFEMTTAQCQRIRAQEARDGFDARATEPVTMLNWYDTGEVLRRVGCDFPTEAQWEYAARAGTTTPWWTGETIASLQGAANILDVRGLAAGLRGAAEERFDDGFAGFAPVGSFRANAWGLHDVAGNAMEWCRDECLAYEAEPRKGDGFRAGQGVQPRVMRGGSFKEPASAAGSATRVALRAQRSMDSLGVRPMRPFDP